MGIIMGHAGFMSSTVVTTPLSKDRVDNLRPLSLPKPKTARHPCHFCWGRRAQSSAQRDQAGSASAADPASTLLRGHQAKQISAAVYCNLNLLRKTPTSLH